MYYRTNRNTKSTEPILLMLVRVRKRVRPSVIICFLFSAMFRNKACPGLRVGSFTCMDHKLYIVIVVYFIFLSLKISEIDKQRKVEGWVLFPGSMAWCCTNIDEGSPFHFSKKYHV